ncbi:MAG: S41 family peptidase [Acidobacteria bacterium]|nr:S41 family peptidase [Acidobacteriota bacterium]
MRNRFLFALSLLLITALTLPAFIYAQRTAQSTSPSGTASGPVSTRPVRKTADAEEIEKDVSEALTVIQDQYIDGNKLDYNAVFKSSITGMLRSLDPHSNYFDRAEFDEFRTDQRSEYYGIGATIGDLREGDQVNTFIRATFENAPAWKAGLRYGDRILEVDGKDMRGKNFYEVRQNLRGPRGSVVKVTVERLASHKVETVEITRDAVPQPSIPEFYMIRPGVGYIAMSGGFNLTTADEFANALENLHSQGMKQLVIDLRGNGGGLLSQAVKVANTFLQRGQLILKQQGRVRGSTQPYYADNEQPDMTPLVVIVNRGTASASEILTGALQDHDRALIVGETSFGKGLVQIPFPLEYGSALLLTIGKYYTPSGRLIQRDYSNAGFYDYYTNGGISRETNKTPVAPTGPESRTDTGRAVYGGGGITPDEMVSPRLISPAQQRVTDPVFAFAMELAAGRVAGFDAYKVQRPIDFGRDLTATDFPMTDTLYKAFKDFVASKPIYKFTPAQLDKERAYIERQLRYELVTAAYGSTTSFQVFNADDPQITKAIDVLPRAQQLAAAAQNKRNPS